MKLKVFGLVLMASMLLAGCGPINIPNESVPSTSQDPVTSEIPATSSEEEKPSSSQTSSSSEETPEFVDPPEVEGDYVSIHYHNGANNYETWGLWLWEKGGEGKDYDFNGLDKYGAIAKYPLSTWSNRICGVGLGFIIKNAGPGWSKKDYDKDRFIDFNKIDRQEDGGYHVYLETGDGNIYVNPELKILDEISVCEFTNYDSITFETSNPIASYKVMENGTEILSGVAETEKQTKVNAKLENGKKAVLTNKYEISVTFLESKETLTVPISFAKLYKTEEFNNTYYYNGNDLGATYTNSETTFKVWSPISNKILLRVYNNGTPKSVSEEKGDDAIFKEVEMTKSSNGVFETTVKGDLAGKYYTYVVTNGSFTNMEIVDPYAKSAGVNGLRGQIVDFSKTNPVGWDEVAPHQYDRKQLTIYETHIADITSSKTWGGTPENAKLFKGAFEEGTTFKKGDVTVSTGFDHIKDLGVNAVQLVPVFDQANDEVNMTFNWGYNPLNYNVIEGGYSSNPYDGYVRIQEFKQLIQAYNKAGINIIMDVVYNHVSGANGSNFDVLMPGYYYRYNKDGSLSNGSGCGNETASEMPMMRKFMIDSTSFLAKEYKLGGFRFDLMGLHDLDTMEQVNANLLKINPKITVFGEPWTGGDSPLKESLRANQANGNKYVGYGQFNDQMRDALIAGGMKPVSVREWIANDKLLNLSETPKIRNGIKGFTGASDKLISDPDKTVNYVTCHDNYTLYDRFKANGFTDDALIKKMAMLANSIVFTSQGTTFMLAGEEFLRTKGGDHNSYQSSYEVNELNYELKVDNLDMFENYKKLINLKQTTDGLHLDKEGASTLNIEFVKNNGSYYKYSIKDTANNKEYIIMHRNNFQNDKLVLVDLSGYSMFLSTANSKKPIEKQTVLQPLETLIVVK